MNPKNTWLWVFVAAGLFAVVIVQRHFGNKPVLGPARLLAGLNIAAVRSVEVIPAQQRSIQAEFTSGAWQLTSPVHFPARSAAVVDLLSALSQLVPATTITASELANIHDANEKFGFNPPPFTVLLQPGDQHIQIGNKNGPGDQVFVRVVGREEVAVVDASLLKLIPRKVDDWRETALADFTKLDFDQLFVTNGSKVLELHRNLTNGLWRMVHPMEARADRDKIADSLEKLQAIRTLQVTDNPKPDWDAFGLQPPEISLAFLRGTNRSLLLAFGKSPSNDATRVYARRNEENAVLTLGRDPLEPWHAAHESFRDRHLITPQGPLSGIEFKVGAEEFTLRRTNRQWTVIPQNYPADLALVSQLITNLGNLEVAQFYKDVVVASDLPALGLANPAYRLSFLAAITNALPGDTNLIVGEVDFGTNQDDLVYARRSDESFVYTVKLSDVRRLPFSPLQLRDRTIWNFATNEVVRVIVRQKGRVRELVRKPQGLWSLAPGSQGLLDDVACAGIEETVYRLGSLSAESWVERGDEHRARYGFKGDDLQLTVELQKGKKLEVEFGGDASLGSSYAEVSLNQEPWIFEFPPMLNQLVQFFLGIPSDVR